jgi:hypothetical protein
MVVLDYAVEIYEGYHYSVDMWLGIVLVSLLWRVLEPFEGISRRENSRPTASESAHSRFPMDHQAQMRKRLSLTTSFVYIFPAVVAYLQLTCFPTWTTNFLIVLYVLSSITIYVLFVVREEQEALKRRGMHVTQHVLLCLLFMALGVYL